MIEESEEAITALVKRVLIRPKVSCQCEDPCSDEDERRQCTRAELERFYTDAQAVCTLLSVHDDYITHSILMSQCPLCRKIELRTIEVDNVCDSNESNNEAHVANVCPRCCRVIKIEKTRPTPLQWTSLSAN